MIPEAAAEQSIYRIGMNREGIPGIIWEQIVEEIANIIERGLGLDPNTGNPDHLAEADQNTRAILIMHGIIE